MKPAEQEELVQPLNQDALLEDSMGEESREAETRGLNYLHLLADKHRNDALEISTANNPPEGRPPKQSR